MDIRQFSQRVAAKQRQIAQLLQRRLPVVVGRLAKNHYQDNFRQSGFVDHGLHPWQPAKRQNGGAGAAARYRTLLSSRNHLFSSINYTPANAAVTVYNNVPYAAAHNDGATVNIPVTSKMRRYAWAKFYEASGKTKKNAKTKKNKPARQPQGTVLAQPRTHKKNNTHRTHTATPLHRPFLRTQSENRRTYQQRTPQYPQHLKNNTARGDEPRTPCATL